MSSSLKIAYYGDDFTGSTDAMEALAQNGLKTILFLRPPSSDDLQRFPEIEAFGIAGVSRSLSPQEMEAELLPAFRSIQQSGVPIAHYKTCSTFDSSPHTGSIGKAIELARTVFTEQRFIPLIVGVPQLKRYTLFGNHFSSVSGQIHRLDRHPVMSRHPVTPMDEADLLKHLAKQTELKSGLINIVELSGSAAQVEEVLENKLKDSCEIVLFDVLDKETLEHTAELLWDETKKGPLFTVGSSGVEYGLTGYWHKQGIVQTVNKLAGKPQRTERIAVVSGSCSYVTEEQIRYAEKHGFSSYKIPAEQLADPDQKSDLLGRLHDWANEQLTAGHHILLYTAAGPEDESIQRIKQHYLDSGSESGTAVRMGQAMGQICRELIEKSSIRRIVVAGGDTSGYVTRELGIYALETLALVDPGVPLCKGYSDEPMIDGIEVALKGGQVGEEDYFVKVSQV
jgi:uncharacterized protein YgbK (DUF1537 family)